MSTYFSVVDCHSVEDIYGALHGGDVTYLNGTTTYGSEVIATCNQGHHATAATLWKCDKHGRWTRPETFKCFGKTINLKIDILEPKQYNPLIDILLETYTWESNFLKF